ncbi:GH92 family glycosyl hydrolase [Paenibacillus glycanilyticus]|uniref:Alpha-1 2-mannosidase n=1 Tax=Paenibacillus glycanilyticus TaxID=126569 RepID=A0ABQ6G942_9BACL|nr:GH92 family glycosyl hydrolase [Paenibacillus glycanilyticus]GLX67474.1 alpha-1 2-mannosidase [Paenibacillus glycanilyticus]
MKQTTINQDLASYVNTNIGTLSYKTWSTSPTVQLPHGMMEINPVTTPGIGDKYLADKIFGFSFGPAAVMISNGCLSEQQEEHASSFDHDQEEARPHKYRVLLEDSNIDAEMTVARHSAYFRFHVAESAQVTIAGNEHTEFHHNDGLIIEGKRIEKGYVCYFSIEMKESASSFGYADNKKHKLYLSYESHQEKVIELKVGISYISLEQAQSNRQLELPDWNFEAAVSRAREAWNIALSAIEVEGGTEEQRTIFYTAMYRTLQRMRNITEDGRYYSGFDGKVHDAEGRDFYTSDQLWDTYRCARPLQSIIEPRVFEDMVFSLVRMYEQGGLLPKFPHPGGDHAVMIGHHAASLIADACMKGLDDIHLEKAYEGMIKDAAEMSMIPWRTVPATELDRVYREQGWFPALPAREDAKVPDPDEWRKKNNIWDLVMEKMPNQITWVPDVGVEEWVPEVDSWHRRQSVSVTLERAYDDWCISQVARKLGRDEEADEYIRRAENYRHLFRSDLGLMAPKTAEGEWVEPFDPKLSGGFAGEGYFAEVNSWIYTFHVQHDVEGLIRLMGGREAFNRQLDSLFTEQYTMEKPWFLGQFPDMSGLIGMYAHGNEPSFHIPYMYNYAGAPWKTQRRVRDIQSLMYNAGPAGLCGDDDIGSLSSWYVFSAMGFYPVCPGRPVYDIGSPLFEKTTLQVGEGKTFVIEARNVSKANKYIQSSSLNGQPHQRPWLSHQELMSGGQLVLEMGPRPNKSWGSSPEDAPPSMTSI